jgi:uncharacterized sporulation protein YeaH/YhbH (DUF444 family)
MHFRTQALARAFFCLIKRFIKRKTKKFALRARK